MFGEIVQMPCVSEFPIDESLTLGLDVGIGSVGSALVRHGEDHEILFAGSRCFEVPEQPKTRELKNKTRREKRGLRRVTRRRRQRLAEIRKLLLSHGLLESIDPKHFHHRSSESPNPWKARTDGLDRALMPAEFAAALLHIAKHRGFKSNRKTDTGQNAPDDNSKMLAAITANRELSARYRTIGEMVAKDPKFADRRRNRTGEYTHTLARDDLRVEVQELFSAQRREGNAAATEELKRAYLEVAFHQRPLQDSEWMVGLCPFEHDEKRSAKHAPSFEKFRLLSKLNTVRVTSDDGKLRRLGAEELCAALDDFGAHKSLTWNGLARKLGLGKTARFEGVDDKKAKQDICASSGCSAGAAAFRETLGAAGWNAVRNDAETLDAIAFLISFRDDYQNIHAGLRELGLEPLIVDALMNGVREGKFGHFKGAGHISAKAARAILPHLLEGKVYSEACAAAGYDHTLTRKVAIDDIRNPVVRRILREARKQTETIIREFRVRPGRIVVELGRQVGKSAEERDKMTRGIDKRTSEKQRHREELKKLLGLTSEPSDEDLGRFELWKEQNHRCIYTDKAIGCREILTNAVQVDHILPRSRSQDNSYHNQALCTVKANQDKGQRTPWEWIVCDEKNDARWNEFEARVRALTIKGMKRRNLLMRNFDEREGDFVARNMNDTKYAARALLTALREFYPDDPIPGDEGYLKNPKRRLFARSGTVTAQLRRAWGLAGLKDRADDRHHALDALICAAARQEWVLERLTREYQQIEHENRARWTPNVPPPWAGFRQDAIEAIERVFVSRSEKRRGRGQGHKDTIYRVAWENGKKVTFERKAVSDLTTADLARIRDGDRNAGLAEALSAWIERGKPKDDPPLSPAGDPIRKVRLRRKGAAGRDLNGGHVDNPDMVRVDVFVKDGKFYLVPIYRHHVMDEHKWAKPPNRAIIAYAPEEEWVIIDSSYEFRFSLYPDSFVEIVKRDGEIIEGYYRSTHRGTGAIAVSPHNERDRLASGIGARTLTSLKKFEIDRFGRRHEIRSETRTWHGAACT